MTRLSTRWAVFALVAAIPFVLVLAPIASFLVLSFFRVADNQIVREVSLVNYVSFSGNPTYWGTFLGTLWLCLQVMAFAIAIGYPVAWFVWKRRGRTRYFLLLLTVLPLFMSYIVKLYTLRSILGLNGLLNQALLGLNLLEKPSLLFLYNQRAVLLTMTIIYLPFAILPIFLTLERIPHNLVEAAEDSGATPWATFRHVIWPLARPGAAIGFTLAFLLCIGDYITPAMVGGLEGTMLGMVIASQFGLAGNWPYGAALAFVMMAAVSLILAAIVLLSRTPGVLMGEDDGSAPKGSRRQTAIARIRSAAAFLAFCLPYVFLYLPLLLIVIFSFNASPLQTFPLTGFTLDWYRDLLANVPLRAALLRSLEVGVLVLIVSIVCGTLFAIILAYGKLKGARVIELLLAVPIAIPGVVLGITMVLACQLLRVPVGLPRIVIGHSSFVMPVIMMIVLARLRRLDPSLIEAAMDCGADRWRAFAHVLLPLIRGSIIGGALLGFTLSIDEVVITLFLTGVEPTLPVWVWNQMRFGFTPVINTVFTVIGAVTLIAVILAQRLLGSKA